MKLDSYTLPKEDLKNLSSAESAFFHQKSVTFVISRNANIDCILISNF